MHLTSSQCIFKHLTSHMHFFGTYRCSYRISRARKLSFERCTQKYHSSKAEGTVFESFGTLVAGVVFRIINFHLPERKVRKQRLILVNRKQIGHFTVVCLVTWPLSGSEAGGDLVLIQTLLLFTCKSCCSHAN